MISSRSDFLYVSMLFFVLFNYLKTHFAAFQCAIQLIESESNDIAQEKTNIQIHFLVKDIGMPKYFVVLVCLLSKKDGDMLNANMCWTYFKPMKSLMFRLQDQSYRR